MPLEPTSYRAIFSSDWSECLSPSGPFDFIAFNYPKLKGELERVFKHYTSNRITLSAAVWQIRRLLPKPVTEEQMDAYLDSEFKTYRGVDKLITWCRANEVLFMINTTGMFGYFQRVLAKGLLPQVSVVSAHPMVRFADAETDPEHYCELFEIEDKRKSTAEVVDMVQLSGGRLFIMGDSGGDGPHFKYGHNQQAVLIGSMTKPSLKKYCDENGIVMDHQIGHAYGEGEARDLEREMETDYSDLIEYIKGKLR